ncbi:MAG: methyl-accepting chemotaxis protein, partial [Sphingomonas sp.]
KDMLGNVIEGLNAVRAYTILAKPEFLKTYDENKDALIATASQMQTADDAEQNKRIAAFVSAVAEWQTGKLSQTIALAANPATRGEAQQLAGKKQLGEIRKTMKAITDLAEARVKQRAASEREARNAARQAMWLGGGVALLVAGLLAWLLAKGLAQPVSAMTETMKRLAEGNNGVDVPYTDRRDEIGDMAKALLVFREAAVTKEQADAQKVIADAAQKLVVDTLANGLQKVAEGDLTATIEAEFAPEYRVVKANYNRALEGLCQLIGSVKQSAENIGTGSTEIATASEDLARRTESTAASLEQISAAVSQIDDRLKAGTVAAHRTVERADQAIATVAGGRGRADEAVEAMSRVAESAQGIDSVIEGLDKIAFQTRVLAMNAAIEAGRAGDAGRGFAVVADLVGQLAMRSEEEAKRAREQLTATQSDVVLAVEVVQNVDGALANISGDVAMVHELLGRMAADNQAQSAAISEIAAAINTMDHATQQNAAMVEETSAAARNLNGEVSGMRAQTATFKIGNNQEALAMSKTPHRSEQLYVKPLPAAAIPALVRASASTANDDWAEF